ncbi:MAG: hypothetical protein JWO94_2701 [Verrucomicrobiaceae bacterium]|nr:hypothetical protein [Verrucomicrobiaceae bacterium]
MKKAFGEYRYLAGSERRRGTLWEGADHLLCIESKVALVNYKETYRRIDYAKVQSITYGRTRGWPVSVGILALLILSLGWWIVHSADFPPAGMRLDRLLLDRLPSLVSLAVALIFLVYLLIRGPACVCKLQTAVQVLRLKPVFRLKDARRVSARIAELCLQHQGGAKLEPLDLARLAEPGSIVPLLVTRVPFTGSALMRWGFMLLLVSGGLTAGEVYVDNLAWFIADVVLVLITGNLLLAALVRSSNVELPGLLKRALRGAVANFVFTLLLCAGLYSYGSIQLGKDMFTSGLELDFSDQFTMRLLRWLSHASFDDLQWSAWLVVASGVLGVFFALLGLPTVLRFWRPVQPPMLPPEISSKSMVEPVPPAVP